MLNHTLENEKVSGYSCSDCHHGFAAVCPMTSLGESDARRDESHPRTVLSKSNTATFSKESEVVDTEISVK
jgi:hypothetical protein